VTGEDIMQKQQSDLSGRIMSGLVILFLAADGAMKLVPIPHVPETMGTRYPTASMLARGWASSRLLCTALYPSRAPRCSGRFVTGYMGGAMATTCVSAARSSATCCSASISADDLGRLYLRDERLRVLIPATLEEGHS